MFLDQLRPENQIKFLQLVYNIAKADNNFADEEQALFKKYRTEMKLEDLELVELDSKTLIDSIDATDKEARIIFIESMAMVLADGIYHDEERKISEQLRSKFVFSEQFEQASIAWLKSINELYLKGYDLIDG